MTRRLTPGHTRLDVTQMQVHLAEAHVKVKQRKLGPLDKLADRRLMASHRVW